MDGQPRCLRLAGRSTNALGTPLEGQTTHAVVVSRLADWTHAMLHCITHGLPFLLHMPPFLWSGYMAAWRTQHSCGIDRGVNGLHIVLLLFAYKLRYPDQ